MRPTVKLTLVLVLVTLGAAISLAGADPNPYRTVGEVVTGDATGHVAVKATVVPGSLETTDNTTRFLLTDGTYDLQVVWTQPLPTHEAPNGLDGRTVVVEGLLQDDGDTPVLQGTDLQVGCPSKYAPADDPAA